MVTAHFHLQGKETEWSNKEGENHEVLHQLLDENFYILNDEALYIVKVYLVQRDTTEYQISYL